MTLLFNDNPYRQTASANVLSADSAGVVLDRTIFYPTGGGQPGDSGVLRWEGGETQIVDTVKGTEPDQVIHKPAEGAALPPVGGVVDMEIDWPRRHRHMRMHTALHLLCSLVEGDVTGGQVGAEKSRLDFNVPSATLDKEALTERLNALIAADYPVEPVWIEEAELDARPDLVRTLSVQPPRGSGRVRLLRIGAEDAIVDLQPCGGTHVARTGEIGAVRVSKIENKGKQNRRVNLVLEDA
jgi:misacylated tRNA(Ala) deacylase